MARKHSNDSSTVDKRALAAEVKRLPGRRYCRSAIDRSPSLAQAIAEGVWLYKMGELDMTLRSFHAYLAKTGAPTASGGRAKITVGVDTLAYYIRTRFDGFTWSNPPQRKE